VMHNKTTLNRNQPHNRLKESIYKIACLKIFYALFS
jgi:hypothetical protein